ncbi:MAG: Xaa-Pro peptidase family protein [Ardenticatenia bacterium]|nr:Xaa-Pro peptidase family protein [Ardenticatenia bacterium]
MTHVHHRLTALRTTMADHGADAFLISNAHNRRYFSGFTGSSGLLLITPEEAHVITDFRYYEQVQREAPAFSLHRQTGRLEEALGELLAEVRPSRVAFEADDVTVAAFERWRQVAPQGTEWVSTEEVGKRLRATKDEEELNLLRRAQAITDAAFERFLVEVEPGRTERELAWRLEVILRELGADDVSFEIIVAVGDHAALPHYHPHPGERPVQQNDIVLVDFGAQVGGYHADMTRTFVVGEPDEMFTRVYQACLGALEAVEAAVRAGMGCREADQVARAYLEDQGFGEHFGHSLGHGVGLEVHERPYLSFRAPADDVIPTNSVITLEPGIYVPGWGGVRIEDLAIAREDGLDVLTQTTKAIDAWLRARG